MTNAENVYSRPWFEFFHVGIDEARTIRESEFICRCAPLPQFRKILDVCCGMGRHGHELANRGYSVVGIDREVAAIAKAREVSSSAAFVVADIQDYQSAPESFDAAIVMGQSFGHFNESTNRDVLFKLATGIRKTGKIILDLWNPEFFIAHQGKRLLKTARGAVREQKHVDGDRLFVRLNYPDDSDEQFTWQLFTPAQMKQLAESAGLSLMAECTAFDLSVAPSPNEPRIQFLLERADGTRKS